MIKIPCDYQQDGSAVCSEGEVLIYGEMGGPLPRWIQCPKCKGTGQNEVTKEYVEAIIVELTEERDYYDDRIEELNKLLKDAAK